MSYLSDSMRYASVSDSVSIPITSLVFERYNLNENTESLAQNSEYGSNRNRYYDATDSEQKLIDRVNNRYGAQTNARNRSSKNRYSENSYYARGGTNGFPDEHSDQYGGAYDDDYTGDSFNAPFFRGGNDASIISLGDDLQSINFNITEQIKYENTEYPNRYHQTGGVEEDWNEEDLHEYGYKYQHGGNPDVVNDENLGIVGSIASLSNVDFDLKKQLQNELTDTETAYQNKNRMRGGNERYRNRYRNTSNQNRMRGGNETYVETYGNRYSNQNRMRGGNETLTESYGNQSNQYRMRGGNETLTETYGNRYGNTSSYDNNGFDDVGYRTEEYGNHDYNNNDNSMYGGNSLGFQQPSLSEVEVNFMNVFNRAKAHVEKIYGKINQNHEYEHGSLQDLNSLSDVGTQTGGARSRAKSKSRSKTNSRTRTKTNSVSKSRSQSRSKRGVQKSRERAIDFYREIAKILHENPKHKDLPWAHKMGVAGRIVKQAKEEQEKKKTSDFKKRAREIANSPAVVEIIKQYKKEKGL